MIEFPDDPWPNGVNIVPIDFGFIQRPLSGAASLRVDRPGNRFRIELSYPPMKPDVARKFMARVQRGKREGIRVKLPLLGLNQGNPGSPVVDGADPTGTTLPLRGLTPGYAAKEGFWLHVEDADGTRYLHSVQNNGQADASGDLTLDIEPPIRAPLEDGATVELAAPTFEGLLVEEIGWSLSVDRLVRFGGGLVIEEAA